MIPGDLKTEKDEGNDQPGENFGKNDSNSSRKIKSMKKSKLQSENSRLKTLDESFEDNMTKKIKDSEDKTDRKGAIEIHVKSHPAKNKKEAVNFAISANTRLMDYEPDNLEGHEPEREHPQARKYGKKFFTFVIFACILVYVVLGAVSKFGNKKIQVLSTKMYNEIQHNSKDYPIKKLFPFHWFLEINREDLVDRMECVLHKEPDQCQLYDEMKCSVYDNKGEEYQDCMLRTYRKFGKEMRIFCIDHYEKSSIFSEQEKSTASFLEQFHGCLQHSGQKKGKRYCDDILGTSRLSKQVDYYACYERLKVKKAEYGEAKCRYENPILASSDNTQNDDEPVQGSCESDDTVADSYGDSCTEYDDNPSWCGSYDSATFVASEACCICGGGTYESADPYTSCLQKLELFDQAKKYGCDSKSSTYDQHKYRFMCWPANSCTSDDTIFDSYGDGCSGYALYPSWCGQYDTDTFVSSEACCACGGGQSSDEEVIFAGTDNTIVFDASCVNDDSVGDSYGDTCSSYYDAYPSTCGEYDSTDFTAASACCVCGGGSTGQQTDSATESELLDGSTDLQPDSSTEGGLLDGSTDLQPESLACEDDLTYLDSDGDGCSSYSSNPGWCGQYDLETSSSLVACCACQSGPVIEPQNALIGNDNYHLDSRGNDCSESYYEDSSRCGQFDTDIFIASQMCEGCGGGIQLTLSDFCDQTKAIIDERKICYEDIEQTKTVGYCDSDVLTDTAQPTAQSFLDCYSGISVNTTDLSLCDNLYPIKDQKIGGSFNLLQCYQTFGININPSDRHDKCSQIHKENMVEEIEAYHQCLIDLGAQKTADVCLLDPEKMTISIEERQMVVRDSVSYEACLNEVRIEKEAYQCKQEFESDEFYYSYRNYEQLTECFEQYYMPMSPKLDCKLQYEPELDQSYQVRLDYNKDLPDNCYGTPTNGRCDYHWGDTECEYEFQQAEYYYEYGYTDEDPHVQMNTNYGSVCEPYVPNYTAFNNCIEAIDYVAFNQQLNDKLETYLKEVKLVADDYVFQTFSNNTEYCDIVFELSTVIESKQLCYEMVEQPFGPEKCFDLPRVTNSDLYHYNYFYKYFCLWSQFVEFDAEASACLETETLNELHINQRDDCLKAYESKGMPIMEKEGSLYLYLQPPVIEDDLIDLTRKFDKETDITAKEIEDFVCDQITAMLSSSPYQEIQDKRNKQVNQINQEMNCEVFQYVNITRDNVVVHFLFNDSESFRNKHNQSYYKDDYNEKMLVINRTDSNQQFLNLTYHEDLQLIQILNSKLYHYKTQINETSPDLNFTIKDEASYVKFFSDSRATKLLESYSQIVSQHLLPNQNLLGDQVLVAKAGKNVTGEIFGIPWKSEDLNATQIELKKIQDKIKVLTKDNLLKEEISRINTFRINLDINFVETVIKIHYYGAVDILSELGGLFASYNSVLASVGFLFLIFYFYQLSAMIHRKYVHKIDIQQVKQFQSLVESQIMDQIKLLMGTSKEKNEKLSLDLETCERLIVDDFKLTYEATDIRLEEIQEIVIKYRPEAVDNIFEYNTKGQTEWEKIEHLENQEKRKMYLERVKMPLAQIVAQVQNRMSFYNIYQLIDDIQANKIKIRKIKYTTRLEKKQIENLQETVAEYDLKFSEQDKKIKVLEEMVTMMNNVKMNDYKSILSKKTK